MHASSLSHSSLPWTYVQAQEPANREIGEAPGNLARQLVSSRRPGDARGDRPDDHADGRQATTSSGSADGKSFAGTAIVLDPEPDPKSIDVIADGGPVPRQARAGHLPLENDRLTICMADADQPRPKDFKAEKGSRQTLMMFTREKPQANE